MSIHISDTHITLHSLNTSYQIGINEIGYLTHLYYGKKLDSSVAYINSRLRPHSFSPFPYDCDDVELSQDISPMEYPVSGSGDFRTPALTVKMPDGSYVCELRYAGAKKLDKKPALPGLPALYDNGGESETVEICLKDTVYDLRVYLLYTVFAERDIIARSARIENHTGSDVTLESALSVCIDCYENDLDFISFYGKHVGERSVDRVPVCKEKIVCESRRGASSHQKNPVAIICGHDCTETAGECFGAALVYSGNFTASIEQTQIDTTRFVMGINPDGFNWLLADGEAFTAPEVIMTYSAKGLGQLSRNYHRIIRNNLCRGKYRNSARPILINNWEATYFNFNAEKLLKIAEKAKAIGVDMLVMDDGWFAERSNDRSSLGDWFVNEEKLGCSLTELIEDIHAIGMKFGIWFEPECVSERSKLYSEHPEWCMQAPSRKGALSRHQWVLDMGNPDAVDAVFGMMSDILDNNPIHYLKWDFNRHLSDIYSSCLDASRQGEASHRFMLGVYDLLERLNTRYPDLLIEGCSGGGGRFDCGMLYYSPQIWTSDNTDAICRTEIQYGTSFCYPVSAMSAHVTVSPNHQTGRSTPLATRSNVAMAGTYGFELDLTKLSDEEIDFLAGETEFYRTHAELIREGEYYRLSRPDDTVVAWEIAAEDASAALITAVKTRTYINDKPCIIKAMGLDYNTRYNVKADGEDIGVQTGCALMQIGIKLNGLREYDSVRIEITGE